MRASPAPGCAHSKTQSVRLIAETLDPGQTWRVSSEQNARYGTAPRSSCRLPTAVIQIEGGTHWAGHASWHLLGLKVFRCRAQWSIQTSDTWCTRCTSTARQQERSQDCGTIPVAATSNGETAPSWVPLSWPPKYRCRLSGHAKPVWGPALTRPRIPATT